MSVFQQAAGGLAVGAKAKATQVATTRKLWLPSRVRQREVMASPPTVTCTAAHTITSPRSYPAIQSTSGAATTRLNPLFRYRRGGSPKVAGTTAPNTGFILLSGVNYGLTNGANATTNLSGVSVLCDGSEIEFFLGGHGQSVWVKVDGQYVSLTPTTLANDGGLYYLYLGFGSAAMREIEIIGYGGFYFGGVYASQTATVAVAQPRGPRTIIMGDSFGEGTGSTLNGINAYPQVFADAMGWDDVRPSAVGATGLIANFGGTRMDWTQRVAYDVIPYAPELFILQGSINDGSSTPALVTAAAQSVVSQVKSALPNCQIVLTSIMANRGPGNFGAANYLSTDALKAVAVSNGAAFINLLEQPTFETFDGTTTTTLAASASQSATTLSVSGIVCPGTSYKFVDGAHVYVKSVSGAGPFTATIDNLPAAQSNGAILTPCGNSLWTGSGRVGTTTGFGNCDVVVSSDSTHPTDAGHLMIGTALAYGLMNVL